MLFITPIVAVGSLGEAGDAKALKAAGITHVILCRSKMVWPHASPDEISVVQLDMTADARQRPGLLKSVFLGLKAQHLAGYKYLFADHSGGSVEAMYLAALAKAHIEAKKFATVMAALEAAHGESAAVTEELKAQGEALLP